MADKILDVRGGEPVGMHWAERLVSRSDELKTAFNRAKDRQGSVQEDPQVVGDWFGLVANVKAKFGIQDDDVHNFDETGFQTSGRHWVHEGCNWLRETWSARNGSARRS